MSATLTITNPDNNTISIPATNNTNSTRQTASIPIINYVDLLVLCFFYGFIAYNWTDSWIPKIMYINICKYMQIYIHKI